MENYAYYGSGLVLDETEFTCFIEQYLQLNKLSKEEIVKETWGDHYQEARQHHSVDVLFDNMVMADEVAFRWGADLPDTECERYFSVDYASTDCGEVMFQPYHVNGKANVRYANRKTQTANQDFVDFLDIQGDRYFFHSDHELDSPEAFEERPYGSYEEFRQEFVDKMGAYLPGDFDWDSHIGRFNYACLT